jgi:D-alanyl-lipoteichoic acid acyltransferase DltB (MBOAT superfamily)
MRIRNTFIIFVVSGFWHGANWTFVAWGALNALFILPSIVMKTNRNNMETVAQGKLLPTVKELFQMTLTFGLTVFAWIFFRSENLGHAIQYISDIFKNPGSFLQIGIYLKYKTIILLIALFILIEWIGRDQQYAIAKLGMKWKRPLRFAMYYIIIILIFLFTNEKEQQFIYFQF